MRVGLTGGIASGKSAVADVLARLGAVVIDADVLAREAVAPGTTALAAIRERFGERVVTESGDLDRAALGEIVFDDAAARRDLEAIVHPRVRRRAAEIESSTGPDEIVVHVIPLLVETGQAQDFDSVVVVDAPVAVQRARLMARNDMSAVQAEARIGSQATRDQRRDVADHVIDNSGSWSDMEAQTAALWSRWRAGAT